jgi:UDPglucose 6-dehydrogenase
MSYTVIGTGKLGMAMAANIKRKGGTVFCVDTDPRTMDRVNAREVESMEPGVQQFMNGDDGMAIGTGDVANAVAESDVIFVVVPTPSSEDGSFSMTYVEDAARAIGPALYECDGWKTIVLVSTVMPGSTAAFVELLEEYSGKDHNKGFAVVYSPEFIALGDVISGLSRPNVVLTGAPCELDERSRLALQDYYDKIIENNPEYKWMGYEEAEWTKLLINSYITSKISWANMITQITAKTPGASPKLIADAVGSDPRIGHECFFPGAPFGGPCFPRDGVALAKALEWRGIENDMVRDVTRFNQDHVNWIRNQLISMMGNEEGVIGVLGIAYKPGAPVVGPSLGDSMTYGMWGRNVVAYDPGEEPHESGYCEYVESASEVLERADVVIVATPHDEFLELSPTEFSRVKVVLDCWDFLMPEQIEQTDYRKLGVHHEAS